MPVSPSEVARILELVEASTLDEIVIDLGDLHVEVRRRSAATAPAGGAAPAAPAATPPDPAPARAEPAAPPAAPAATAAGLVEVRSPMVGTFYRRQSPEAPPFVEVGTQVGVGDPLCLVEVMKLFTTVDARVRGRVAEILAEDGTLVEYDQVLFRIDPG